jgi:hypothetical protein
MNGPYISYCSVIITFELDVGLQEGVRNCIFALYFAIKDSRVQVWCVYLKQTHVKNGTYMLMYLYIQWNFSKKTADSSTLKWTLIEVVSD